MCGSGVRGNPQAARTRVGGTSVRTVLEAARLSAGTSGRSARGEVRD